jgi:hypothetical protein
MHQQPPQPRSTSGPVRAAAWALRALRVGLGSILNVAAALVLLFEEWGWKPLAAALGWLARFRLVQRIEAWIAGLPPYGALAVFALPATLLFPLKLVALWLLARGMVIVAGALFVGAKIASTALVARIFMLTRPALMRIGWFARTYDWVVPWQEAMFAAIRASWAWRYGRIVKARVLKAVRSAYDRLKPRLSQVVVVVRLQAARLRARMRIGVADLLRRLGAG